VSEDFEAALAALRASAAAIVAIEARRAHPSHRRDAIQHVERAISGVETWEALEDAHAARAERLGG
jgi:hypothetical protein